MFELFGRQFEFSLIYYGHIVYQEILSHIRSLIISYF